MRTGRHDEAFRNFVNAPIKTWLSCASLFVTALQVRSPKNATKKRSLLDITQSDGSSTQWPWSAYIIRYNRQVNPWKKSPWEAHSRLARQEIPLPVTIHFRVTKWYTEAFHASTRQVTNHFPLATRTHTDCPQFRHLRLRLPSRVLWTR